MDTMSTTNPGFINAPTSMAGPKPQLSGQPDLQVTNREEALKLLGMVVEMREAAATFLSFVEQNRSSGSSLGFESLASEISLVASDEHMSRLQGALTRAAHKGRVVSVSEEGFAKLHRLERLLGEASARMSDDVGIVGSAIPFIILGALGVGILWLISGR